MHYYLIILYYIINIVFIRANEFKLSDSKVLLPRTSFLSINYTIKGSPNICHEWISDTPEVIIITPIYNSDESKCSQQAIITSVWQSNNKATGTVYAKNIATGHSVKCDVIIDQISKLEIETRTLELYLHETPEALIARAYDEYGNTFSTLDGIPFEWLINSSGSNGDAQNALRFITWIESEYSTPTLIGNLEQQGLQGYMQLVSGLKTGGAEVQLTFRDEKIKTIIKSKPVRLLVMANAALSPPLAYLIPHTQLSYKIIVHSQGSSEEISMPNNQYRLQINNTDLAELDEKGSTITAKKYGQTEVTLMDTNIKESFRHPSSLLYIVEPGFLTFHISPNENQWVLQTEKDNIYIITIRPYDFNSHPIFMSDNLRLQTTIPKEYFEVLESSANGTYNVVKTIKEGKTSLKSKLMFILLPNKTELKLDTPVEGFQDLIIFPPIKVFPKYVVLPWYPNVKFIPGYLLTATGGSGEYKWLAHDSHQKTTNLSVAVDHKGYIIPLKLGVTHVVAADQRNLNNKGFSTASVDYIYNLEFILDIVEVEVNNEIDLPFKTTNNKNYQISHCHWLPFNFLSEDASIIQIIKIVPIESSQNSEACALLRVRGLRPGFSKITVSLETFLPNKAVKDFLISSITIGSFLPTKFLDPSSGTTTIAVRSNRLMNIAYGPLPWLFDPSSYFYEMQEDSISKRTVNKVSFIEHRPNNKFRALLLKVQCLNVGEVNISIVIGNKQSLKNPKPIKSVGIAKVICTVPVRMKLVPQLIVSNISAECPFKNTTDNQHITVNNKSPSSIQVVFTDKNGVQIERSESLVIKIEIKSLTKKNVKEIVRDVYPNVIYSSNNEDFPIGSKFVVTPYQIGISTGEIEIIAKSNSCSDGKCPAFNLESRLHMQISKSMVVYPEKISLYQHEKVGAKFSIKFGSGYFIITTPNTDFLQINKIEKQFNSEDEVLFEAIQTKVDFSQRNAIINIRDSCFSSLDSEFENSKTVEIELVKPFKLQLFSLSRIQLGSQINVLLKIFDDTGREFPHDSLNMLSLMLYFNDNSNVISVNFLHSKDWILAPNEYSKSSGFIFKVNGEKIGFDSIFVKLENTEITSNILKIEVFPPLKLVPKYNVLLEGAEIQLSTTGGPQNSHDLLHYSIIKNNTVKSKEAKIEFISGPNGLIKAIGYGEISVVIKVEVTDIDPTRDNEVTVLSEDEGRVGVVQIKSLAICSPTKSLLVENSMPLWITFTSSFNDLQHIPITGFSLTGLENADMSFKWHLNPPQGVISKLENILEPTGINIGNNYLHSGMRLITLNPGKQTIEVSVSNIPKRWLSKDIKQKLPLVSKLNVAIISKLEILHPISFVRSILVPPATRITLKSSLDNVASITYTLIPYQGEKASTKSKSKIHSGNILETNSNLSGNEVENFILHITSCQIVKLNTANEITANQTVALFFTVKHPTYSMMSPYISSDSIFKKLQSTKRSNKYSNIFVLPLGGPFEFQITNHDELGTIFDISPETNMFSYRLHRSDNIAITISSSDNFKTSISLHEMSSLNTDPNLSHMDSTSFSSKKVLQFQGLSTGDNAIQLFYHDVFSDSPHLTDIICIPTGSILEMKSFPQKFATEGSRVKYEAPFSGGYWYSSDGDVVAIDSVSGEAILKKRGSSNIFYSLTSNYPNVEKSQSKNVLIGQELDVHGVAKLSMKIFDGTSLSLDDLCSDDCIPMNLNYQSNSLVAAIFLYASDLKEYEKEKSNKFEKELALNYSEKLQSSIPLECDIDIGSSEDSILNFQDMYKTLFKVSLLPISTEFDNNLGIKQWGCLISPNSLSSVTRDQLIHLISSLKSDLKITVQSKLRNSNIKSTSISISTVFGYVLLMNNASRTNLVIKESGEVITAIQLALPTSTKNLLEENKHIKLTVSSNRSDLLEVLAPREDVTESGVWVYPLKAVVVDKIINEHVEVVIEFPLTKQKDVISLQINIQRKLNAPKAMFLVDSNVDDLEISQVNWFSPVLVVVLTAIIAICIVMLVNYFIQPKLSDDRSLPSPVKDQNSSFSGNNYNFSSLHTSPRYTQHIWNSFKPRKDYSPTFNDYSTRSKRYPIYPNNATFQDFNDGYKSNFQ